MNAFQRRVRRQILPRLLPHAELSLLVPDNAVGDGRISRILDLDQFERRKMEFLEYKSPTHGTELIICAYLLGIGGDAVVTEACDTVESSNIASPVVRAVAMELRQPFSLRSAPGFFFNMDVTRQRIARAKRALSLDSRNAMAYLDLAYYYTVIGLKRKALAAVEKALYLGSENGSILRFASRLYHHFGDPQRGLSLLRKSPLIRLNPLVLASEIGLSNMLEMHSPNLGWARRAIDSFDVHPFWVGELAGACATAEFAAGPSRLAKRLANQASRCPDENTFAQLQWLGEVEHSVRVGTGVSRPVANFEADASAALRASDFSEAYKQAQAWVAFQPFSERPAIMASYVAAVGLEDYAGSAAVTRGALTSNPGSFPLSNNLAVCLASTGDAHQAAAILSQADMRGLPEACLAVSDATWGLIAFRTGDIAKGRSLYSKAMERFATLGDRDRHCLAGLYWAREELEAATLDCRSAVAQALSLVTSPQLATSALVLRLRRSLES